MNNNRNTPTKAAGAADARKSGSGEKKGGSKGGGFWDVLG